MLTGLKVNVNMLLSRQQATVCVESLHSLASNNILQPKA